MDSGTQRKTPISRGDIYWVQLGEEDGFLGGIAHPYVVVQENVLNRSRLDTVVVCALTSNLERASWPGNVLLAPGEADLPRQSIVEVSKVTSVKKSQLGEFIGSLTERRVKQIFSGMRLLEKAFSGRRAGESKGVTSEQQPGISIGDD